MGAAPPNGYDYLRRIQQPTLVVNGLDDIIVPTINSYLLQQHLPMLRPILGCFARSSCVVAI
jgi:pimeloyl-ACP methyl ester carboxylesterase